MTRTRRTFTPLDKWVKNHQAKCSFNHLDNLTDEEIEMRQLRKENQQLNAYGAAKLP
ncbi:hypothetical protein [Aliicoccus persicus]|uniref:hypothetical protein n=1 Tax=Aliicoccus persicus TaxID=930138 RepID=UPI0015D66A83|nr:hypothetical protein [Aliicoccus persicus]